MNLNTLNGRMDELKTIPTGTKLLPTRWVYAIKTDDENRPIKAKARLVVLGNLQNQSDYGEHSAPVVSKDATRIMFAYAASKKFEIHQADCVAAYLNAPLEKHVLSPPLPGQEKKVIWRLKKAVYGLRQSGFIWAQTLATMLIDNNFLRCPFEPCLYRKGELLLGVYVDDLLITGPSVQIESFIEQIGKEYEMKYLGKSSFFLGINIYQENNSVKIGSSSFIERIGIRFNLKPVKRSTPLSPKFTGQDQDANVLNALPKQNGVDTGANKKQGCNDYKGGRH